MTAIQASDILFMLAAPTATAGNGVMGVAGQSWGGFLSATPLSATAQNNLFADITGAENAADAVDYACVFILNNTTSGKTMVSAMAWLPTQNMSAGGATLALAADPTGISVKTSTAAQALTIPNAFQAPAGITTWAAPSSTASGGVALGAIAPGSVAAVWLRRSASATPGVAQTIGLQVAFDTSS